MLERKTTGGVIRLSNAVFYAHHGVLKEEHRLGGRFEVDVNMEVDFAPAAEKDDLSLTVDYVGVYKLVERVVTDNHFYLIERLSWLIAKEILDQFQVVSGVEVAVRKQNPPVGGTCDAAEAHYYLRRGPDT